MSQIQAADNVNHEDTKEKENLEHNGEIDELSPLDIKPVCSASLKTPKANKLTLRQKIRIIKENTTVEPIIACYIMPSVLASLAIQNLNLEKACRVNLNFTTEICDALTLRKTENYTLYEDQVQTLTATMTALKNVVQTAIPLILIVFVGAWSDKTGKRKACILIPIIGEFITSIGFMVNYYFFYELSVEYTAMTESIFPAITGGWFTNFIGVYSYIGDITTKEERTYRLGIVNLCSTLGIPVGSALSGVLLSWVGYYGTFSISASLYIFALAYGYFYLEDPKRNESEKQPQKSSANGLLGFVREFFDVRLAKETFRVALKDGPGNRRLRVCLLLIVVCVIFGPIHGEYSVMYIFTRYRFKWDEINYSIWSTYCMIINMAGTIFSIKFFSYYLQLDDTLLGIISNTSKIVAGFGYAFARNDLEIYLAPLLEILNGTSFIAMRSIASKLVTGDEYGKVNSLFALAEAAMPLVYGPLYSRVYIETLEVLPGAFFLLGAVLTLPSIAIFAWLFFEHKKDRIRNAKTENIGNEMKQQVDTISLVA